MNWMKIEDGGLKFEFDQGDFTDAIETESRIIQGGNGKWTCWVAQHKKGRLKKLGRGRIASKIVHHYFPPQVQSQNEAIKLCEAELHRLGLRSSAN